MKTKFYELANGSFTAPVASTENAAQDAKEIRALSDEHLVALCNAGLSGWSYRGAAKKENDGKTFTLVDVCEQLCKVTVKGGEPSKQDKELATDFMKATKKDVDALEPREGMSKATSQELECRERFCDFIGKAEKKWGFTYSGPVDWTLDAVSEFRRTFRLAKARFLRNADDI